MEILPILSTLRRHRITALLVVMEIALTCAIVCNAVFLVTQRLQRMDMPSGVAEKELVVVQVASIGRTDDAKARTQEDLAQLRQIPGVTQVTLASQVPFTNSSSNTGIKLTQEQKLPTLSATQYFGEDLLQTLGTQLVAGRYFTSDEYLDFDDVVNDEALTAKIGVIVITRGLADKLWPGESPLGKSIIWGDISVRVVGVVAGLIRPSLFNGDDGAQWSMAYPLRMNIGNANRYVLRTSPEQREQVLAAAVAKLKAINPRRIITSQKTLEQVRDTFFQDDRSMAGLLIGVCVALLGITALGIVGLASFWVAQRRRTIGVRRALGATRRDILHYFQTENFLLATIGIALGMVLAYGINLFLMTHYELPRLPTYYLPIGAVLLWLIGQIAVLGPALRAAAVPPVVATRAA